MILSSLTQIFAPAGRGSVIIITALLLSSASVRLMTSANGALAQNAQLPTAPMPAGAKSNIDEAGGHKNSETEKHSSLADHGEISGLINALTERELQVVVREKQLEMRMRALSVADAEIGKRLKSLAETEEALRATLSLADEASEKDLLRLTSVYESMKPKDAAILFEEMEPNFAAGFLGRMRPDIAAQVMAGLSPQIAYSISVILAGRNASVPKT
jgi:flagellar motility protein MotE (MotC chaperone)